MNAKKILLEYAQNCRDSARNWLEISESTDDPNIARFAVDRAIENARQAEQQEKIAEAL